MKEAIGRKELISFCSGYNLDNKLDNNKVLAEKIGLRRQEDLTLYMNTGTLVNDAVERKIELFFGQTVAPLKPLTYPDKKPKGCKIDKARRLEARLGVEDKLDKRKTEALLNYEFGDLENDR